MLIHNMVEAKSLVTSAAFTRRRVLTAKSLGVVLKSRRLTALPAISGEMRKHRLRHIFWRLTASATLPHGDAKTHAFAALRCTLVKLRHACRLARIGDLLMTM